jgi:hypothetical protein
MHISSVRVSLAVCSESNVARRVVDYDTGNPEEIEMGKTYQSIEIDAPVETVWNTICNFHDMSWSPNVIEELKAIGDVDGNQVGAKRMLNGAISETLLELNEHDKTVRYSIDDGPSPLAKTEVDNYVGCFAVKAASPGSATLVEWSSSWEKNDDAVGEFCSGIYVALLNDMKSSLEGNGDNA